MFLTPKRLRLYLGALLVLQVFGCFALRGFVHVGIVDLRAFYTAGYMLRSGNTAGLYDYQVQRQLQNALVSPNKNAIPFMPLPYTALLFIPLSFLSFFRAYIAFLIINLLLLALAARLMTPWLGNLSRRWKPLPLLLFFTFLPACYALVFGQLSFILLVVYCLCFVALQKNRPVLAGFVLSLALMKFQYAVPVALLFFLWRQWRFIAGFVAGTAGLLALSAWIVSLNNLMPYLRSLFHMSGTITPEKAVQMHYAIFPAQMANIYGLFFCLSGGAHLVPVLTVLASALLIAWAAFQPPSLPLALLVSVLVSYHFFHYDLTLLLLPLSLMANRLLPEFDMDSPLERSAPLSAYAHWSRVACFLAFIVLFLDPIGRFFDDSTYLLAIPILVLVLLHKEWAPHGPLLPDMTTAQQTDCQPSIVAE